MSTLSLHRLPATSHLLSLESAIRNGSITKAGQELCLTQSAVSKQLSQLEAQLGVELIRRTPSGVLPTAAGKRYLEQITPLLVAMEDATVALMANRELGVQLRLCVAPSFASFWLLPRLRDFQLRNPEILVHITTQAGMPDLIASRFDMAIVNVLPSDDRYCHESFMTVDAYAVHAPVLAPGVEAMCPSDLVGLPLLHQTTLLGAWKEYFSAAGVRNHDVAHGPRYSTLSLGLQAALAGLGCALLPDYVTEPAIREGRLRRIPEPAYQVPTPYSLVYVKQNSDQPAVMAFRDWLFDILPMESAVSQQRPAA